MKTKKYRATTMREALEQVKQELGEEALVIDSRRVRAGGLLGFGSQEMVEVRVATDSPSLPASPAKPKTSPIEHSRRSTTSILNLTEMDEETAAPSLKSRPRTTPSAFAALAARSYASNDLNVAESSETLKPAAPAAPVLRDSFEIAETAPRVVHRPKPVVKSTVTEGVTTKPPVSPSTEKASTPTQHNPLTKELEQIRAELREVKFSLSALSTRPPVTDNSSDNILTLDADTEIYDSPFYEAYLELADSGLSPELARGAIREIAATLEIQSQSPNEVASAALVNLLDSQLSFAENPFTAATATSNASSVLALVGPTGVGKTTTIAKIAARLALRERRRVELITIDTYRIAAVEQLKTYAEIIGAGCHIARSVLELDALIRRFENEATVLIDTAGRSPHDLADQMELADYLRTHDSVTKCLVLQATTNQADAAVTAKKFALYGANNLAITKLDETIRPGAAINIAADASLPLLYLCAGQRVPEDFEQASSTAFAARVLIPRVMAVAA